MTATLVTCRPGTLKTSTTVTPLNLRYLHGLFDNASAVDALVSYLSDVRGLPYEPVAEKGDPYDNLARHLEGCLDVEKLMEICGV